MRRIQTVIALVLIMSMGLMGTALAQDDPLQPTGRTVQNIDVTGEDGSNFTGRIVNLDFVDVDEDDGVLATGRLVGTFTDADGNVERINQTFEQFLGFVDEDGNPLDPGDVLNGNGVTQILFLELGPIFLDLLGLIVEVPDPIILEIRAEQGPGQLLGNLLVALLGILDP